MEHQLRAENDELPGYERDISRGMVQRFQHKIEMEEKLMNEDKKKDLFEEYDKCR